MNKERETIIVVRKKKGHGGGHHGGAWKVAFADFMTSMMALFLVLWLVTQSSDVRAAIAGYFQDPLGRASEFGSWSWRSGIRCFIPRRRSAVRHRA